MSMGSSCNRQNLDKSKASFAKKSVFWFLSLFVFITLLSFQNCSRVNFHPSTQESDFLKSENNGGYYTGKPLGIYYHYVPEFTCQSQVAPTSILEINDKSALLTENKLLQCGAVKKSLVLEDVDASIYQKEIIGYQERIFEGSASVPTSIPANLVEVWCKDRNDELGIETILHYDRVKQIAVNRIYYSEINSNGKFQAAQIPDFSVSRVITMNQVLVKDENGFELTVFRDQPSSQVGLFKATLKTLISGKSDVRETSCRLGGNIDVTLWPAKQIVDLSISTFKISPDQNTLAFNSNTITGVPLLYTINSDGTNMKQVSSNMVYSGVQNSSSYIGTNYQFTPDSKYLVYSGDPRISMGHELFRVNIDGTNPIQLSPAITRYEQSVGPDFVISKDGSTVIYRENIAGAPSPIVPALKSVSINGGIPNNISPPTTSIFGLSSFLYFTNQNKVGFTFTGDDSILKLYSANIDGSGLTNISPPLASGIWKYPSLGFYRFSESYGLYPLLNSTGTITFINYFVSMIDSSFYTVPNGCMYAFNDNSQNFAYFSFCSTTTGALNSYPEIMNLKTSVRVALPVIKPYGGTQYSTVFFTEDSSSLIAQLKLADESFSPVAIDPTTGLASDLCPGVKAPQLAIHPFNDTPGKFLILANDPASQIIDVYLSIGKGVSCSKINSSIAKVQGGVGLISYSVARDQQRLLVNISNQLLFIPLNGAPSYVVNSPAFSGATITGFGFTADTNAIYFTGKQTRPTQANAYIWTPPTP